VYGPPAAKMPVLLANRFCGNIVLAGFVKLASVTRMPGQPAATENVPVALAEPTARDVFVTDSLVHPPAGVASEFVPVFPDVVVSRVVDSAGLVVSAAGGSAVDSVPAAGTSPEEFALPSPAGTETGSLEPVDTTCESVPVAGVPESSATAVPAKAPRAHTATRVPRYRIPLLSPIILLSSAVELPLDAV
jgi:hypothetical protein